MDKQEHTQHESKSEQKPGWERELVEKLAFAAVKEQTKARRWGIFFKALMFAYLFAIFGITMYPKIENEMSDKKEGHTAVIDVFGEIGQGKETNADTVIEGLRNAIKDKNTKGIILQANSPGGSPVQSSYIYDEISKIKKEHPEMPIYTVVSDICASGCYYLASASDKIFVNQASLIGSIGVIMNGFGFVNVMEKLGVERRLLTAGEHKAMLDPFSPSKEDENQYMQNLINQVHQQFIRSVREGRGERLKEQSDIFSGLVWTGEEGVKKGLVDGFGSADYVAREIIHAKKRINFTPQERFLERLSGKLGVSIAHGLASIFGQFTMR